MSQIHLKIDEMHLLTRPDVTILEAAQGEGIYIPALCSHPSLPPFDRCDGSQVVYQGSRLTEGSEEAYPGCQLCLVEIEGEGIKTACNTLVQEGMIVYTNTPEIIERRQKNLKNILSNHPHSCLVCPQKEGCGLKSCISNVPENERCCSKFNVCELRKIAEYVGMTIDTPPYVPKDLPVVDDEPLFKRDYNLCIGCTRCVRACNDLRGIGALTFSTLEGRVVVGTREATLKDSGCRFCGACVEVCPTGALTDKGMIWADRDKELVPCKYACPAGIDVPAYVALIAEGDFSGAAAVLHEAVPFPATLGRVCFHPCEDVCRRKTLGGPIAIRELKRSAAAFDDGLWKRQNRVADKTDKKVAIVGSGPSGMTCAYYMAKQGHAVIIFEGLPDPGGMLRFGIPEYRLPREVLDREIQDIQEVGVEIKTNSKIESLDELFGQGFDAVFLALGLQEGANIGIKGEDLSEVVDGVSFLREANSGKKFRLESRVAVIGGGNVAIDASRTAFRLGAKEVRVLYRRSEAEMPAYREEVEQALAEGIEIDFLTTPQEISKRNGSLDVTCLRMELSEVDNSGRRRPIPIEGSEFHMACDSVIIAVGQKPKLPDGFGLLLGSTGYPQIDERTLATSRKGVFAGGDMVTGPSTVVEAIAMGKRAAVSMDQFLGGKGIFEANPIQRERMSGLLGRRNDFGDLKRIPVPTLHATEKFKIGNFSEICQGYSREQAVDEAQRCLRCDLRLEISSPVMPPEMWTEFNAEHIKNVPEKEGVFRLFDGEKKVICIKGAMSLLEEMENQLRCVEKARYFTWEEDPMYAKRESELLQQYLQQHGCLPEGNAELDDDLY